MAKTGAIRIALKRGKNCADISILNADSDGVTDAEILQSQFLAGYTVE